MKRALKIVGGIFGTLIAIIVLIFIIGTAKRGLHQDDYPAYPFPNIPVELPRDHAAHPDYKTEWWYYTGHVHDENNNRYGFELTFFRVRTVNMWYSGVPVWWIMYPHGMNAHMAIADVSNGRFYSMDVIQKNSSDNVGAATDTYKVWINDWFAMSTGDSHQLFAEDKGKGIGLNLTAKPAKPAALHGEKGYHWKGASGIPSYYITYPRMDIDGSLLIDGKTVNVTGQAWMDHEYTSFKPRPTTRGWDWFAIQLNNDFDVMLYQMHTTDGKTSTDSTGTIIDPEGVPQPVVMPAYKIKSLATWTSEKTGATYPSAWEIELPEVPAKLTVKPVLDKQEMIMKNADIVYWEGACDVVGAWGESGEEVQGKAYVELSGYLRPVAERF